MTWARAYWQVAKAFLQWPREVRWLPWPPRRRQWRTKRASYFWDRQTGESLSCPAGRLLDRFTFAPNLILPDGTPSAASDLHDIACETGQWDSGAWMTIDDAARILRTVLAIEGWPDCVAQMYTRGVTSLAARAAWNAHDDGRPRA